MFTVSKYELVELDKGCLNFKQPSRRQELIGMWNGRMKRNKLHSVMVVKTFYKCSLIKYGEELF